MCLRRRCDGLRSYLSIYENLVRDTDPMFVRARGEWRTRCRERVAEEMTKAVGTPADEHWNLVLRLIDTADGPPPKS